MPTASEIVDNRAIVARIHRRRHSSGISQFDDGDDSDNPLVPDEDDHQNSTSYNYLMPFHPGQETRGNDDSVDNQVVTIEDRDHTTYENIPRERRSGGGKWPKQKYMFNSSSLIKSGYRKRNCSAENCVHQYGGSCADILLQPHLYPHICKNKGLTTSSNPLLEYCLDGAGQVKNSEDTLENREEQLPPLLALCSNFSSSTFLMPNITCFTTNNTAKENEQYKGRTSIDNSLSSPLTPVDDELALATNQINPINTCEDQSNTQVYNYLEGQLLCQAESGCDINVQNSSGFTALHFLINGCSKENFPFVLRAVSLLIHQSEINVSLEDILGNTPFNAIFSLLNRGLYRQSFLIAKCLLQNSNCDVNHVNLEGRSLLSHSVCHGDKSIDLSRLLLNNGAKIFPTKCNDSQGKHQCVPVSMETERNQSAFTWFLQSVMETYSLHNTEETVRLICQGMSEEEETTGKLKNHVLSTMVHVGKYGNRNCVAPIFVELKKQMSIYWSLPQPLTYHCLKAIRKSLLRPKNDLLSHESISSSEATSSYQLNLPSRIMSYLQLN